ncbi:MULTISPECIES: hypothetical protein [Enterococcus]|uniref:Uncharacterized protein n=1 Tax=Enterococcus thailandicus TaxID=417368 RepID=A0A179ESX1_ENTTH|nr:hypothetical protein [Enterococcus thailandicus]MDT2750832.1 hypothetical protein [Enterococcus thailandicus]MDT2775391.1 hypothetical protein [Enterococcus thailandicus]MDT2793891.1 hypothetical protein [Enterococcus thailandicus]OAQ56325.1 hypothetical protein A6E74_02635 [Enterococcus thailandicus]
MKSLGFIRLFQFFLLIASLFFAMKHNLLLALFIWALSGGLSFTVPQKYRFPFWSPYKGLLFPVWIENIMDLVITIGVLLLVIFLS